MSDWLLSYSKWLDSLKACYNGVFCLVKKISIEHIIYYNFSFFIEKSFWNLSSFITEFYLLLFWDSLLLLTTFFYFPKKLQ